MWLPERGSAPCVANGVAKPPDTPRERYYGGMTPREVSDLDLTREISAMIERIEALEKLEVQGGWRNDLAAARSLLSKAAGALRASGQLTP